MVEYKNVIAILITAAILFFLIFGFPGLNVKEYLGFGKDVIQLQNKGPLPLTGELSIENIDIVLDIKTSTMVEGNLNEIKNATVNQRRVSFREDDVSINMENFVGLVDMGTNTSGIELDGIGDNLDLNGIVFNDKSNFNVEGSLGDLKIEGIDQDFDFEEISGTIEVKTNSSTQNIEINSGELNLNNFKGSITIEDEKLKINGEITSVSTDNTEVRSS